MTVKKLASVIGAAAAFAFLATGTAGATNPPSGGFDCQNGGTVNAPVLSCNDTTINAPITLNLHIDRTLSGNEIVTVEDTLNHTTVTATNLVNVKKVLVDACGAFSAAVDVDKVLVWGQGRRPRHRLAGPAGRRRTAEPRTRGGTRAQWPLVSSPLSSPAIPDPLRRSISHLMTEIRRTKSQEQLSVAVSKDRSEQ
ncbi:hypothetical protein [Actinokineospora sp. NBRC 105648]|uniref:hypothetical protein n=1 Tax=Actinokineospora sp. NBRC 105648 TaxID=3032206 RepID=UPI0024A34C0E|nr:hypothetical protein [Actinokineospora sp. NBRC 105648]GLZ37916.1 hypothetical protein Acsp05_15400 [Actinokineospora sp. NBRC 105648]